MANEIPDLNLEPDAPHAPAPAVDIPATPTIPTPTPAIIAEEIGGVEGISILIRPVDVDAIRAIQVALNRHDAILNSHDAILRDALNPLAILRGAALNLNPPADVIAPAHPHAPAPAVAIPAIPTPAIIGEAIFGEAGSNALRAPVIGEAAILRADVIAPAHPHAPAPAVAIPAIPTPAIIGEAIFGEAGSNALRAPVIGEAAILRAANAAAREAILRAVRAEAINRPADRAALNLPAIPTPAIIGEAIFGEAGSNALRAPVIGEAAILRAANASDAAREAILRAVLNRRAEAINRPADRAALNLPAIPTPAIIGEAIFGEAGSNALRAPVIGEAAIEAAILRAANAVRAADAARGRAEAINRPADRAALNLNPPDVIAPARPDEALNLNPPDVIAPARPLRGAVEMYRAWDSQETERLIQMGTEQTNPNWDYIAGQFHNRTVKALKAKFKKEITKRGL